ncbi:MAG TPA: prepilin-type N-terminal cleavage/methylation domain-containing protein [Chthoniobacter sp.]
MSTQSQIPGKRGFVLLEAMLAVAIFAIAVLALGRCLAKGLNVERLTVEDSRACRILENRATEIEGGEIPATTSKTPFNDINGGLLLTQASKVVHRKDEKGQEMADLYLVTLEATWKSDGASQTRSLNFYLHGQRQP